MANQQNQIISEPRWGYTLPVFATAAAVAALQRLQHPQQAINCVNIALIEPAQNAEIPIEQIAHIADNSVLAITRSDPGDNLDITRNTPVWAVVTWQKESSSENPIIIEGGEGIGLLSNRNNQPAIYAYAKRLLRENLQQHLHQNEKITVQIILPEGRQLATRTSNEAFGVIQGLSLLGTSGISQPLSAPGQLEACCQELREKACKFDTLVLCVGENGLSLAEKMGINPEQQVKTANWLGPVLATAGFEKVKSILLFGYHGKLIKLAGGIFHTHHHLADGRLEILTAYSAIAGVPEQNLQAIFTSETAEDALTYLSELDKSNGSNYTEQIYTSIAQEIDRKTQEYIYNHTEIKVQVGSVLFGRRRQIIVKSEIGGSLLGKLC